MRDGSGLEYDEPRQKLRFTFGCYKTDIFRKPRGQTFDLVRCMRGTNIMSARKRFGENRPVFVPTVALPGVQPLCLRFLDPPLPPLRALTRFGEIKGRRDVSPDESGTQACEAVNILLRGTRVINYRDNLVDDAFDAGLRKQLNNFPERS